MISSTRQNVICKCDECLVMPFNSTQKGIGSELHSPKTLPLIRDDR